MTPKYDIPPAGGLPERYDATLRGGVLPASRHPLAITCGSVPKARGEERWRAGIGSSLPAAPS
jgi:hypothetical protein